MYIQGCHSSDVDVNTLKDDLSTLNLYLHFLTESNMLGYIAITTKKRHCRNKMEFTE